MTNITGAIIRPTNVLIWVRLIFLWELNPYLEINFLRTYVSAVLEHSIENIIEIRMFLNGFNQGRHSVFVDLVDIHAFFHQVLDQLFVVWRVGIFHENSVQQIISVFVTNFQVNAVFLEFLHMKCKQLRLTINEKNDNGPNAILPARDILWLLTKTIERFQDSEITF